MLFNYIFYYITLSHDVFLAYLNMLICHVKYGHEDVSKITQYIFYHYAYIEYDRVIIE